VRYAQNELENLNKGDPWRDKGDPWRDKQVYHSQCNVLQELKDYLGWPKCTGVNVKFQKKIWGHAPNHILRDYIVSLRASPQPTL